MKYFFLRFTWFLIISFPVPRSHLSLFGADYFSLTTPRDSFMFLRSLRAFSNSSYPFSGLFSRLPLATFCSGGGLYQNPTRPDHTQSISLIECVYLVAVRMIFRGYDRGNFLSSNDRVRCFPHLLDVNDSISFRSPV